MLIYYYISLCWFQQHVMVRREYDRPAPSPVLPEVRPKETPSRSRTPSPHPKVKTSPV